MAGSVNRVTLIGNLGKDPDVRTTNSGGKVANFSLATSESWNDKASGERKEQTEWHRITVLNEQIVSVVERFLHKGSKIFIQGSLHTRKWTDQSGQERYTTEVVLGRFGSELVLLDKPGDGGDRGEARPASRPASGGSNRAPAGDFDSEIPF